MSLSALVIHQEENAAVDSADKSTGGPVKKQKKKVIIISPISGSFILKYQIAPSSFV